MVETTSGTYWSGKKYCGMVEWLYGRIDGWVGWMTVCAGWLAGWLQWLTCLRQTYWYMISLGQKGFWHFTKTWVRLCVCEPLDFFNQNCECVSLWIGVCFHEQHQRPVQAGNYKKLYSVLFVIWILYFIYLNLQLPTTAGWRCSCCHHRHHHHHFQPHQKQQ